MDKYPAYLYKTLVIGVIIIFVGVGIQPAFATVYKKEISKSNNSINISENDTWLGQLIINFDEEINCQIRAINKVGIHVGRYYIEVLINYKCPPNRKIVASYDYIARLQDLYHPVNDIIIVDKSGATIINGSGSNPPPFYHRYPKYLPKFFGTLYLKIEANLKVFELVNGSWVQIDSDHEEKIVIQEIFISDSRNRDITNILHIIFEKFPFMEVLLRKMNI